jgi:hypothetical protein
VRVNVNWAQVAPARRQSGFSASDSSSPGYRWDSVDGPVRQLTARGISVLMTIVNAPRWAEGRHRPHAAPPGSWRPSPKQFAEFATAAARRYDGRFPDPARPGSFLPRVRLWQAWNEPNLGVYLSPQWTPGPRHTWRAIAPIVYRAMLNAFYTAVKHVSPSNRVFMAGTAPYGDPPGSDALPQERTAPIPFYRSAFCLSSKLKPQHCPNPAHFDGLDHHPYGVGGPNWHAVNHDDVAVPDIHKITRVLRTALSDRRVLPRTTKSIWVTELGWNSKPPNHHGVPVAKDARWYEQAFYVLWQQGVHTIMATEIRDPPPSSGSSSFGSGLYLYNGKSKGPMVTAYRFPFVGGRLKGSTVHVWGRAPQAGRLAIQVLRSGHWSTLRRISVQRHSVFSTSLTLKGGARLRAELGSQISLTWRVHS